MRSRLRSTAGISYPGHCYQWGLSLATCSVFRTPKYTTNYFIYQAQTEYIWSTEHRVFNPVSYCATIQSPYNIKYIHNWIIITTQSTPQKVKARPTPSFFSSFPFSFSLYKTTQHWRGPSHHILHGLISLLLSIISLPSRPYPHTHAQRCPGSTLKMTRSGKSKARTRKPETMAGTRTGVSSTLYDPRY